MYFCLPKITNSMYNGQLREMVSSPSQNTVGFCNQITLYIPYYISSRMVTLLKIIDAPIEVSDIFYLTVSFKFINFSFQIFFLFLKCLLASRLTLFRLSTLLWFGTCTHCILSCFLWPKKYKYSSSNHVFCCFNLCRAWLSLAEVLIFSLMFSQALFMSLLSLKFSKAGKPVWDINLILFLYLQLI